MNHVFRVFHIQFFLIQVDLGAVPQDQHALLADFDIALKGCGPGNAVKADFLAVQLPVALFQDYAAAQYIGAVGQGVKAIRGGFDFGLGGVSLFYRRSQIQPFTDTGESRALRCGHGGDFLCRYPVQMTIGVRRGGGLSRIGLRRDGLVLYSGGICSSIDFGVVGRCVFILGFGHFFGKARRNSDHHHREGGENSFPIHELRFGM